MTATAETKTGPRYVPFDLFDVPLTDLNPRSEAYALAWLHHARKADWACTHALRRPDGTEEPPDAKAEARFEALLDLAEKNGVRKALGLPESDPEDVGDPLLDQVCGVDPWLPPPRDKAWDALMDLLSFAGKPGGLRALGVYARDAHGDDVQAALDAFCAKYPDKADALRQQVAEWQQVLREKRAREAERGGFDLTSLAGHQVSEIPWVVRDLLAPGAALLVGRPKGGKSLVTADMVFAVGHGRPLYGREVTRSDVLWIAAEDTKDQLARRLKKRGEAFPRGVTVFTDESIQAEKEKFEDGITLLQWLRAWLTENPSVKLAIVDTHATAEALWQGDEQIARGQSVVTHAYKKARDYQIAGLELGVAIVLVHHTRKRNGKEVSDYHELINLPQTIVAGVTSSIVLADLPDASPYEPKPERVWAVRGRHMRDSAELLTMGENLSFELLGDYHEIQQSKAQAEIMETIEALLEEQEQTSIAEVAAALGKNRSTVKNTLRAMALAKRMEWKGRVLEAKVGKGGGLRWKK